jgi:hypothetical protein
MKEIELAWEDELLIIVGYNLEVFTILWRAHYKNLIVKGFDHQRMGTYQGCDFLDIQVGHWGRQYAVARSHNSHRYDR